jgi:protein TonB
MKPDHLLNPDLLSILFENRNREYGAYELRIHYKRRLLLSLCIVPVAVSCMLLVNFLNNRLSSSVAGSKGKIPVEDSLSLVQVDLKPLLPLPAPPKTLARPIAPTVPDVTPTIVRDQDLTTRIPTIEQLDVSTPGTLLREGDGNAGEASPKAGNGSRPAEKTGLEPPADSTLRIAENMPEFPGGLEALKRFLVRNLRMPQEDMEPGSTVRVLAEFVVNQQGNLDRLEILQSGGKEFDNEVFRVIKKMPPWKPGSQNGRRVAVFFKLPILFQVPGEN